MPFGSLDLLAGAGALFGVLALVFVGRYAVAYARSDDFEVAWDRTTQWTMAVAMGLGAAVSTGLIQLGDLLAAGFEFVVGHPFAVSNLGITGLGAGALSGVVSLSSSQFVGLAVMIVGAILLFVEVDDLVE
ncbi:hypothetical protein IL252_11170 [Halomicrobium sp. IBSBa]|uniref:Uncharacterized protein n=1 Tax=Halomicrobium mukohataei TaxID=57705 RepID=A0A847TXC8_9EURY|nr:MULTISPECIES: hypothetical protein [Halomicrobium]MBO4248374.1 hypothetical protein [Halomicrobium sp. IBSBa]NLV10672.1 hypothetical protein [Halomicrobium mukohataei]